MRQEDLKGGQRQSQGKSQGQAAIGRLNRGTETWSRQELRVGCNRKAQQGDRDMVKARVEGRMQ